MADDIAAETVKCNCEGSKPDRRNGSWTHCQIHVDCDANCKALNNPTTIEECMAALEHWQAHSCLGGCSHGW